MRHLPRRGSPVSRAEPRRARPGQRLQRTLLVPFLLAVLLGLAGCDSSSSTELPAAPPPPACAAPTTVTPPAAGEASWAAAKAAQAPVNALPLEFGTPSVQPLSTLAWEDGIYISRDGLNLYATYIPMDLLSAVFNGATPPDFYTYMRGPTLAGQVFTTTISPPNPWLHSDIAIAQRTSTSQPFSTWCLSAMNKADGYDLGAFQGDQTADGTGYDRAVYTDDEIASGGPKIGWMQNVGLDPAYPGVGAALPAPLNAAGQEFDNPHIEAVGGTLVLFFDSQTLGCVTEKNVFYSTSVDDGATWTTPANVTSVNATATTGLGSAAQQPHLYFDGTDWWLYFSAANPADGRLAIYRAKQGTGGDWNSFGAPELVVGAGTTSGVGEPTVTAHGDLSFVAITHNPSGTSVDAYDADAWFMAHQ